MKNIILNIKGTKDIMPDQTGLWHSLESYIHDFLAEKIRYPKNVYFDIISRDN